MRRGSLWWWAPPVVLGLAAALLPAEPTYSPHSFSDHLVLARQLLLGSAAVYLAIVLLFRILRAMIAGPRQEDARRGFDAIARSATGNADVPVGSSPSDGPPLDGAK